MRVCVVVLLLCAVAQASPTGWPTALRGSLLDSSGILFGGVNGEVRLVWSESAQAFVADVGQWHFATYGELDAVYLRMESNQWGGYADAGPVDLRGDIGGKQFDYAYHGAGGDPITLVLLDAEGFEHLSPEGVIQSLVNGTALGVGAAILFIPLIEMWRAVRSLAFGVSEF